LGVSRPPAQAGLASLYATLAGWASVHFARLAAKAWSISTCGVAHVTISTESAREAASQREAESCDCISVRFLMGPLKGTDRDLSKHSARAAGVEDLAAA